MSVYSNCVFQQEEQVFAPKKWPTKDHWNFCEKLQIEHFGYSDNFCTLTGHLRPSRHATNLAWLWVFFGKIFGVTPGWLYRIELFDSREIPVLDGNNVNCKFGRISWERGREFRLIPLAELRCYGMRVGEPSCFIQDSCHYDISVFCRMKMRFCSMDSCNEAASNGTSGYTRVASLCCSCVTLESRRVGLPTSCHICTVFEARSWCSCTRMAVTYRVPDVVHGWLYGFFGSSLFL